MKIAIIGYGAVGSTLAAKWVAAGHQVAFGARDPLADKVKAVLDRIPGARAASIAAAAESAEVVVLTTPWHATEAAVAACRDLSGKIVLDCTNPLRSDLSGLSIGHDTSAGEQVQAWAQGASVAKVFNSTGANNMEDPNYGGQAATMFYCADDKDAKQAAHQLAADCAFDPVDVGPLRQARLLEPLAMLWISMAFSGYGRDFCFKLLRR